MNPFGSRLLDVVTYLPLVGAAVLLLVPKDRVRMVPGLATVFAGLGFLASLPLWLAWESAPVDAHGGKSPFYNSLKLEGDLKTIDDDFFNKFRNYLFKDDELSQRRYYARRILKAAHYLALNWEFKIIYNASSFSYGITQTKEKIENEIEDHFDLIKVQKIILGKKSHGFIDLCGQLTFQQRWSQTPRLPRTSVLGHMLAVAILLYLFSKRIEKLNPMRFCNKRLFNNFFGALFHG